MPVYNEQAIPLIKVLEEADKAESLAIKALSNYMETDGVEKIKELANLMELAHDRKMVIYNKMQSFKIG
jgi:hypothetical protein